MDGPYDTSFQLTRFGIQMIPAYRGEYVRNLSVSEQQHIVHELEQASLD